MDIRRLVRFLVVGAFNTLFGYGLYAALIYVGLPYPLASLIALIIGMIVGYFATGRVVFGHRDASRLGRYFAAYGLLYLVNLALLTVLIRAGLNEYTAGIAAIPPMALFSYWVLHRLVFSPGAGPGAQ